MALFRLMYISSGRRKFDAGELEEILAASRKTNAAVGVTRMLLYLDGNFLQLLEGEREEVETLYERILLDKRHGGAIALSRAEVEERLFPDWAMGLKTVDGWDDGEIEGLFRLDLETLQEKVRNAGEPLTGKLIETFLRVNA